MSYRCQVCLDVSQPGHDMLRHVISRPRCTSGEEIAREVAVCRKCHKELQTGILLSHADHFDDLWDSHSVTRLLRPRQERRERKERKLAAEEAARVNRLKLAGRKEVQSCPP